MSMESMESGSTDGKTVSAESSSSAPSPRSSNSLPELQTETEIQTEQIPR